MKQLNGIRGSHFCRETENIVLPNTDIYIPINTEQLVTIDGGIVGKAHDSSKG